MAAIKRINIEDIVDYFEELEDPRTDINIKHPLVSVVVIAMMAVLAGANGPTAIAKWAKLKKDFLVQALPLPHGVPCKDVFRAVLSLLKPEAFQKCFAAWLSSLRDSAEEKAAEEGLFGCLSKMSLYASVARHLLPNQTGWRQRDLWR